MKTTQKNTNYTKETNKQISPFNNYFSRINWQSQCKKGKYTILVLMNHKMMGWHQLDHMSIICTLCQTDNNSNISLLNVYRPDLIDWVSSTSHSTLNRSFQ